MDFGWAQALVVLVAVQRLVELKISWRNEERLRAAGAREFGRPHYPLIVLLHAGWLTAIFLSVPATTEPWWPAIVAFVGLQVLRLHILATLGRRWSTRILVLPGEPLVAHGLYRWIRHPNYLVVVLEIALLPMAFGAWIVCGIFSALNALVLAWRVRIEERALDGEHANRPSRQL